MRRRGKEEKATHIHSNDSTLVVDSQESRRQGLQESVITIFALLLLELFLPLCEDRLLALVLLRSPLAGKEAVVWFILADDHVYW
jgi:hypothetical protein